MSAPKDGFATFAEQYAAETCDSCGCSTCECDARALARHEDQRAETTEEQ